MNIDSHSTERKIEAFTSRVDAAGNMREMQWTEHLGNRRRHRVELLEDGLVARCSIRSTLGWVVELELRRASREEPFVLGCAPAPFREALGIMRDIELGGTGGFNEPMVLPA